MIFRHLTYEMSASVICVCIKAWRNISVMARCQLCVYLGLTECQCYGPMSVVCVFRADGVSMLWPNVSCVCIHSWRSVNVMAQCQLCVYSGLTECQCYGPMSVVCVIRADGVSMLWPNVSCMCGHAWRGVNVMGQCHLCVWSSLIEIQCYGPMSLCVSLTYMNHSESYLYMWVSVLYRLYNI